MASGSNQGRSHDDNVNVPPYTYDPQNFVGDDFDPFFGAHDDHAVELGEEHEQLQQTQESIQPSEVSTTKASTRTSYIWDHYKKIENFEAGPDRYWLKCNYCEKSYQYRSGQGYGSMARHLDKHKDKLGDKVSSSRQAQISAYGTNSPPFHFNDKVYRDELGRFISVAHLPFSFGEKASLVDFLQRGVNPQAKRVPRNSIKRTIRDIYKKEKKELQEFFANFNGHVHICSDAWSDHWQTHSYMGITCHWIDETWNIQKRILAFRIFDGKHTSQNIAILITHILEEYYLINKVFSIGFDNASANTASLPALIDVCKPNFGGKFFHIRCTCHVLNLCVKDGLSSLGILIDPIKKAVQFLWKNPQKMKEWGRFCKSNGFKARKFSKDVPTRWNSTYKLLEETYEYRDLLVSFISHHSRPDDNIGLYSSGWDNCKKVLSVLASFNTATLTLSGVYYPTSHLFLIEAINIVGMFDDVDKNNELLVTAIELMREKWLSYYKDIPMIYLVAFVFDPRSKLEGLCDYLTFYYQCLHICDDVDIPQIGVKVKKQIIEIYNEYANRCGVSSSSSSLPSTIDVVQSSSSSFTNLRGYEFMAQRQKKQKGVSGGSITELDSYLTTLFEFNEGENNANFNILEWWKRHELNYPILSLMAKQILATPCSTVAVEQAFSAGGNILDETRSRLTPQSLEMQVCVDDWTKAQYRQQEIDKKEHDFFSEEEATTTATGSDD